MDELDRKYPMYGFSCNRGYGTADHQNAIKKHGVTSQHRRSFAPISLALRRRPAMVEPTEPSQLAASPLVAETPLKLACPSDRLALVKSPPAATSGIRVTPVKIQCDGTPTAAARDAGFQELAAKTSDDCALAFDQNVGEASGQE